METVQVEVDETIDTEEASKGFCTMLETQGTKVFCTMLDTQGTVKMGDCLQVNNF